ncbi:MAG: PEP-CTERM sorting domain-containing protein [Roseibacillus sp.]
MKIKTLLTLATASAIALPAFGGTVHVPGQALALRTNDLNVGDPNDQFTGALPANDGSGALVSSINVDTEAAALAAGLDMGGDNFDWALTFQFYDGDGNFSFTENYDDRVQINITPIVGPTNLTATGAGGPQHQDTSWNTRTYADYSFGSGGWFHAEVIMTEDGGGAQSAGGIGFGYSNAASTGAEAAFAGIGYGAVFDTDAGGLSWGSAIVPEPSSSLIAALGGMLLFLRRRR